MVALGATTHDCRHGSDLWSWKFWQSCVWSASANPRCFVSRASVVVTRRDAYWLIALMHNTLIFNKSQPEAVERLLGSHPHRNR